MDIKKLYDLYLKNRIVSIDSRNITPGCIFFALKGENFNGNAFAQEAIRKGAVAAIVDEEIPNPGKEILKVDHVLTCLQELALYHRLQMGITILAITGSNGKTTTKELCRAVLSAKFRVSATVGNLNNHIGVPLTLLAIEKDCQMAIIEMGANHPGEINMLCDIARPDYGLITNIGKAHLEGFGGIHGVARAKGELFTHLIKSNKTIFLNCGDHWLQQMVPSDYPYIIRYNGDNGLKALSMSSDPFLHLKAGNDNTAMDIHTNLAGSYNVENVLAACTVGQHFGIGEEDIVNAINGYYPQNNRSQIIKTDRNTIFMDAYNANPSSMAAAIHEFLSAPGLKKMLILGEMREVGDASDKEHEEIVDLLKSKSISSVICVGKAFQKACAAAGFTYTESVDQLNQLLAENPLNGYFIFVKGSRSNRLEKVIPLL